tara:strand:+ start:122 stop:1183 length:1062 start_codon:yes stop_codon:yes gene_type:complete
MALALLMAALSASSAMACSIPFQETYYSADEAIEDASWIAWARAVQAEDGRYEFEVIEYLKGRGPSRIRPSETSTNSQEYWNNGGDWLAAGMASFVRPLGDPPNRPRTENFYGHSTAHFWTVGTDVFDGTDCLIRPEFVLGRAEYLVFGPHAYSYGFEAISGADDLWLNYVRDKVQTGEAVAPFPQTLEQYLSEAIAVIRVQAVLSDDGFEFQETVLKGENDSYLEAVFVMPEVSLRDDLLCRFSRPSDGVSTLDRIYVIERISSLLEDQVDYVGCGREYNPETPRRSIGVTLSARGRYARNAYLQFDVRSDGTLDLFTSGRAFPLLTKGETTDTDLSLDRVRSLLNRPLDER